MSAIGNSLADYAARMISVYFANPPLRGQKTCALDQAAPLVGWDLPQESTTSAGSSKHPWASAAKESSCRIAGDVATTSAGTYVELITRVAS